ncbi:MAG: peptide ABC transporter substrate-binding protein [Oscillospiraceae bacterium]
MKHCLRKLACGGLAILLLFVSIGCSYQQKNDGTGYLFTLELSGNPACLDPQYTENVNAFPIIANMMEGLFRLDADGNAVPAETEEYIVSDDGLQYRFRIKEDCYWYGADIDPEKPLPVTAEDYVFAFQRLVDPAMRSPYSQKVDFLKNASKIIAGKADAQSLGVLALDDKTIEFQLEKPNPEFLQILAQNYTIPCNEKFFRSSKGRYGLDEKTILSNGAFYLTKWNYDQYSTGNFITMRKNKLYYDADAVSPSSLQFNISHDKTEAQQNFADGNSDAIVTDVYPKDYLTSAKYTVKESRSITMGLIFNPEHPLLKNDKLRQALACSINRVELSSIVSEDIEPAYGLIAPAVTMLGRSYRELYADEPLAMPYDPITAGKLFERASAELGLNSMNTVQIMVSSTIRDTDALLAICQEWQNIFGYYIGIETVSPDEYNRRLKEGEYSIALWGFTPDRNSGYATLKTFDSYSDLMQFRSNYFSTLLDTLSTADKVADSIVLYGTAEQTAINTRAFIPLFYKNRYLIYTSVNTDIEFNPFLGSVSFRNAKHFS